VSNISRKKYFVRATILKKAYIFLMPKKKKEAAIRNQSFGATALCFARI